MFAGQVFIHVETVNNYFLLPDLEAAKLISMALILPEESASQNEKMGQWIPQEFIVYLPSTIENITPWLFLDMEEDE